MFEKKAARESREDHKYDWSLPNDVRNPYSWTPERVKHELEETWAMVWAWVGSVGPAPNR